MYHDHKTRAPLPVVPAMRLVDQLKQQMTYHLFNDVLSKSTACLGIAWIALKQALKKPAIDAPAAAPATPAAH